MPRLYTSKEIEPPLSISPCTPPPLLHTCTSASTASARNCGAMTKCSAISHSTSHRAVSAPRDGVWYSTAYWLQHLLQPNLLRNARVSARFVSCSCPDLGARVTPSITWPASRSASRVKARCLVMTSAGLLIALSSGSTLLTHTVRHATCCSGTSALTV
jgi:hypothetical protein